MLKIHVTSHSLSDYRQEDQIPSEPSQQHPEPCGHDWFGPWPTSTHSGNCILGSKLLSKLSTRQRKVGRKAVTSLKENQ